MRIRDKLIYPLLIAVFVNLVINHLKSLNLAESLFIVIFLFVIVFTVDFCYERCKRINELNRKSKSRLFDIDPNYSWSTFKKSGYFGVLWEFRTLPSNISINSSKSVELIDNSKFDVKPRPLCPKCKNELSESRSFFGGYNWKCLKCNFKKRNKNNFKIEAVNIENIIKSKN